MDIKIGDSVKLKKGGPYMTVEYIIGHNLPENCGVYYAPGIARGSIICSWTGYDGEQCGKVYKQEELELVTVFNITS